MLFMAWKENEKKTGAIRVGLSKQDLEQIEARDVHQAQVLEWVKKGRERDFFEKSITSFQKEISQLRDEVVTLKTEQRNHILLLAQLSHLLTLMTTEEHSRLRKLREKVKNKQALSEEERAINQLFEAKSLNFQSFIEEIFSGLKTNCFLAPQDGFKES